MTNEHDQPRPPATTGRRHLGHYGGGTEAPWYEPQELSEAERARFRSRTRASSQAKAAALRGEGRTPVHPINEPRLRPEDLMPTRRRNGLRTISLFSGGGGLDLGFDLAGFQHVASFEIMTDAAETLQRNRPRWQVFSGDEGDVRRVDWSPFKDSIDVLHGGPPCQPFSVSGRQRGSEDGRDLFPVFVDVVRALRPRAFVAENVFALASPKFANYRHEAIIGPLAAEYSITLVELEAADFGVPQTRRRLFFVGLRRDMQRRDYVPPRATHSQAPFQEGRRRRASGATLFDDQPDAEIPNCMGVREALGLPDIGIDGLAPTIRSGLTGPRHTTSILSSVTALRKWNSLQIWPNGVARTREAAHRFVPENGHFRLAVADCAMIQGFPNSWEFTGAVYMATGQIGNSVVPPMAYRVARSLESALRP